MHHEGIHYFTLVAFSAGRLHAIHWLLSENEKASGAFNRRGPWA